MFPHIPSGSCCILLHLLPSLPRSCLTPSRLLLTSFAFCIHIHFCDPLAGKENPTLLWYICAYEPNNCCIHPMLKIVFPKTAFEHISPSPEHIRTYSLLHIYGNISLHRDIGMFRSSGQQAAWERQNMYICYYRATLKVITQVDHPGCARQAEGRFSDALNIPSCDQTV